MKASVVDLRYRMKAVLAALDRGEEITLLFRGKEKAKITPLRKTARKQSAAKDKAFGLWRDNEKVDDVKTFVDSLRKGRQHDL